MTLTADAKKRVVVPGGAPGDVYACEQTADGVILRRVYRPSDAPTKKLTKAEALKVIRGWRSLRGLQWEELRKETREL